jgi:hypothetical protein
MCGVAANLTLQPKPNQTRAAGHDARCSQHSSIKRVLRLERGPGAHSVIVTAASRWRKDTKVGEVGLADIALLSGLSTRSPGRLAPDRAFLQQLRFLVVASPPPARGAIQRLSACRLSWRRVSSTLRCRCRAGIYGGTQGKPASSEDAVHTAPAVYLEFMAVAARLGCHRRFRKRAARGSPRPAGALARRRLIRYTSSFTSSARSSTPAPAPIGPSWTDRCQSATGVLANPASALRAAAS